MFKVRFHLAKGINYKKWQITHGKKVEYVDPEKTIKLHFGEHFA